MVRNILNELTARGVRHLNVSTLFFVIYALCGTAIMLTVLFLIDRHETPAKALSIFSPPWMGNFLSEPAGRVCYRIENRLEFALQPPPCGAFSPALQAFLSFF